MTKEMYEEYPQSFLVDLLLVAVPTATYMGTSSVRKLREEVCNCCNFHEHKGNKEKIAACKLRQQEEGVFLASFLRACMSEVYDIEDEELEAESDESTEDASENKAAVPEEKFDPAMPLPAGIEMTNGKVGVDEIPREVDGRLDTGLLVNIWEGLGAHDDYEILLHGG
jgi:hypothetical protein